MKQKFKDYKMVKNEYTLGPWNNSRQDRLFLFHQKLYKIRLFVKQKQNSLKNSDLNQQNSQITNSKLQQEIDHCISLILKEPPKVASPTRYNISDFTKFIVELRTWNPEPELQKHANNHGLTVHPYSFKVSGTSEYEFMAENSEEEDFENVSPLFYYNTNDFSAKNGKNIKIISKVEHAALQLKREEERLEKERMEKEAQIENNTESNLDKAENLEKTKSVTEKADQIETNVEEKTTEIHNNKDTKTTLQDQVPANNIQNLDKNDQNTTKIDDKNDSLDIIDKIADCLETSTNYGDEIEFDQRNDELENSCVSPGKFIVNSTCVESVEPTSEQIVCEDTVENKHINVSVSNIDGGSKTVVEDESNLEKPSQEENSTQESAKIVNNILNISNEPLVVEINPYETTLDKSSLDSKELITVEEKLIDQKTESFSIDTQNIPSNTVIISSKESVSKDDESEDKTSKSDSDNENVPLINHNEEAKISPKHLKTLKYNKQNLSGVSDRKARKRSLELEQDSLESNDSDTSYLSADLNLSQSNPLKRLKMEENSSRDDTNQKSKKRCTIM